MTAADNLPVIGFIGLGYMGHGMASNILKGGYTLWVKGNRNRSPIEALIANGASEADSLAEMAAHCDIIHLCLPNSEDVEQVILGPGGLLSAGKRGLTIIDSTTADPTSTTMLVEKLDAAGMIFVDAPLGRTPKEAAEGTLDAMVGCNEEDFARLEPLIGCWAGTITRIGPAGSAHRMKLIMNFIAMGYGALYAEAVTLAAKSGVSPQTVRDVIGASRMNNGFFETFMRYTVDRDENAHKFTITNASKDVRYAMSMATETDTVTPMGAAIRNTYAHVEAIGHGDDYVPMVGDHVARLSGIEMADEVKKGEGN